MRIIPRKPGILRSQIPWRDTSQLLRGTLQSFRTMVLLALLLTLGSLLYLWQWMNYLQVSYDVQNLEKEHQQMSTRLEMLGVEIDYLSRPQRIETIAREQMLMGLPHPSQIYTLEEYAAHVAAQP